MTAQRTETLDPITAVFDDVSRANAISKQCLGLGWACPVNFGAALTGKIRNRI